MRSRIFLFLLVATLGLAIPPARAADWYVSTTGDDANDGSDATPFATIAHAFSQAADGDRIIVKPGDYDGCIVAVNAQQTSVHILAEASLPPTSDVTATRLISPISCSFGLPVIAIGASTTLEGFTIMGGTGSGVIARGSSTVTNNIIEQNISSSGAGVFIYTANCYYTGDTTTTITNNIIRDNQANFVDTVPDSGLGGGIFVRGQFLPLSECGVLPGLGSPTIIVEDNTLERNSAQIAGGGIYAFTNTGSPDYPATVQITNNVITDSNFAGITGASGAGGAGGGIFALTFGYYDESIDIGNNVVADNTTTGTGGGIAAEINALVSANHSLNVHDNTITGNTADLDGGGLLMFLYAQDLGATETVSLTASGNVVTGNQAVGFDDTNQETFGGGGVLALFQSIRSSAPGMEFRITGNRFTDNAAEQVGGGASLVAASQSDDFGLNPPDGILRPATATIEFENNLVARNDVMDLGGGFSGGAGGGIYNFITAFGEATSTTETNFNTVVENTNVTGSGGIEIETFLDFDNQGQVEGMGVVTIRNSIIADNGGFGIGGLNPAFSGGGTELDINTIEYSLLHNNASVLSACTNDPDQLCSDNSECASNSCVTGLINNYEGWINDRSGFLGNIDFNPLLGLFPGLLPDGCSPTIDAADPALDFSAEPAPNGGRANMGHTGGTSLATLSAGVCELTCLNAEKFITSAQCNAVINCAEIASCPDPTATLSCDTSGTLPFGATMVNVTCTGQIAPPPKICTATVVLPDPSGDGAIDGVDVLRIDTAFSAVLGDPRYLAEADIDGTCPTGTVPCVDGEDLMLIMGVMFGTSCSAGK